MKPLRWLGYIAVVALLCWAGWALWQRIHRPTRPDPVLALTAERDSLARRADSLAMAAARAHADTVVQSVTRTAIRWRDAAAPLRADTVTDTVTVTRTVVREVLAAGDALADSCADLATASLAERAAHAAELATTLAQRRDWQTRAVTFQREAQRAAGRRWSVGVSAGYGVAYIDRSIRPAPVVALTVSRRLF